MQQIQFLEQCGISQTLGSVGVIAGVMDSSVDDGLERFNEVLSGSFTNRRQRALTVLFHFQLVGPLSSQFHISISSGTLDVIKNAINYD